MDQVKLDSLGRDLTRLLGDLRERYAELATQMEAKLEAIRRADSELLQSITARELALVTHCTEREGLRRQMAERIGECIGRNRQASREMRVSEMAEYLPEPRRSALLSAAAGLRIVLERVDGARRVNALATGEMLRHLGEILSVMTSGGQDPDVYSRRGRREGGRTTNVFEAVG